MAHTLSLAPFRGITNKHYRHALHKHIGGYDRYYAPFITGCGHQHIHPSKLADLLPPDDMQAITIPQIISNDAREIIALAKALHDAGYRHLNWNLGCPFRRITHKKRGSGLLPYPGDIAHILETVFQAEIFYTGTVKLSIKTRTGYYNPQEIRDCLPIFNAFPIDHLILHPRTGKQLYSGQADAAHFAHILEHANHPAVYNGDIHHRASFGKIFNHYPRQRSWMLGRGALINPFLAQELQGIHLPEEEKRTRLAAFHQSLWQHAQENIPGESRQTGWMKAVWHYLSGMFTESQNVFSTIKRAQTKAQYTAAAEQALQQPFALEAEISSHFHRLCQ